MPSLLEIINRIGFSPEEPTEKTLQRSEIKRLKTLLTARSRDVQELEDERASLMYPKRMLSNKEEYRLYAIRGRISVLGADRDRIRERINTLEEQEKLPTPDFYADIETIRSRRPPVTPKEEPLPTTDFYADIEGVRQRRAEE